MQSIEDVETLICRGEDRPLPVCKAHVDMGNGLGGVPFDRPLGYIGFN